MGLFLLYLYCHGSKELGFFRFWVLIHQRNEEIIWPYELWENSQQVLAIQWNGSFRMVRLRMGRFSRAIHQRGDGNIRRLNDHDTLQKNDKRYSRIKER